MVKHFDPKLGEFDPRMIDLIEEMSPSARADFAAGLAGQDLDVIEQLRSQLTTLAAQHELIEQQARDLHDALQAAREHHLDEGAKGLLWDVIWGSVQDVVKGGSEAPQWTGRLLEEEQQRFQHLRETIDADPGDWGAALDSTLDTLLSRWPGAGTLKALWVDYPLAERELVNKARKLKQQSEEIAWRARLLQDELRHQRGNTLPESWQEPMKRYVEEFYPHLTGGAGPIPIGDIDIDVDVDVEPPDFPSLLARLEAASQAFAENVRV